MKKPCSLALSMTQCSVPVSLSCALLVKSPQGVVLTRLITPKSPYHMQYCFMVFYYEISIILSADRLQTQPFEFLAQLTSAVPRSRRWAGLGCARAVRPREAPSLQRQEDAVASFRTMLPISVRCWFCQLKISPAGA